MQLEGGYTGITKNASYGQGAGWAEWDIGQYYIAKNYYYAWQAPNHFVKHAG